MQCITQLIFIYIHETNGQNEAYTCSTIHYVGRPSMYNFINLNHLIMEKTMTEVQNVLLGKKGITLINQFDKISHHGNLPAMPTINRQKI